MVDACGDTCHVPRSSWWGPVTSRKHPGNTVPPAWPGAARGDVGVPGRGDRRSPCGRADRHARAAGRDRPARSRHPHPPGGRGRRAGRRRRIPDRAAARGDRAQHRHRRAGRRRGRRGPRPGGGPGGRPASSSPAAPRPTGRPSPPVCPHWSSLSGVSGEILAELGRSGIAGVRVAVQLDGARTQPWRPRWPTSAPTSSPSRCTGGRCPGTRAGAAPRAGRGRAAGRRGDLHGPAADREPVRDRRNRGAAGRAAGGVPAGWWRPASVRCAPAPRSRPASGPRWCRCAPGWGRW